MATPPPSRVGTSRAGRGTGAVAPAAGTRQQRLANLARLFKPQSIAVVGGEAAAEVMRQCRRIGFTGDIWPVNSQRGELDGVTTFASIEALPGVPDATFIAVSRDQTVGIVRDLVARGAPAAVSYASGFAEVGGDGVALQEELVQAAGALALLGPNCYGVINYLDGVALWPDHLGGARVERGVAIITQSGNVALNLTMQGHHLPIAYMVALGNQAVSQIHDCMAVLLEDERVTAIGLYIEGLNDVAAFSDVALKALARGVPIVALKAGSSEIAAQLAASHTRSLVGSAVLYGALFERLGIAQVGELGEFLETLKLVHAAGSLPGTRVASLSCSGGDALLAADLGLQQGLSFPVLATGVSTALTTVLGPRVPIHNPLDYQTYIWGDEKALTACFTAMMGADVDVVMVVLDFPKSDLPELPGWDEVVNAFIAAHTSSEDAARRHAILVSSMPELMPAHAAARLIAAGIAPMQGLRETMVAIRGAAAIGARQRQRADVRAIAPLVGLRRGPALLLGEFAAKQALAAFGVTVPRGERVRGVDEVVRAAERIGYPVVLKAAAEDLAHKTEAGAVALDLRSATEVRGAARRLAKRFDQFLVESMVQGALAELIVGVTRDPQFGLSLTIGAGGVLVELIEDSVTLLLPCSRPAIEAALRRLRCFTLLAGFRGRPPAALDALVEAIDAIAAYAETHADRLVELDVNPLIATAQGAVAVDALIRLVRE